MGKFTQSSAKLLIIPHLIHNFIQNDHPSPKGLSLGVVALNVI